MTAFSLNQVKKLRLIYFPFLKVSLSFTGIYTFLHWYFIIHLRIFSVSEDMSNAWVPAILSWGAVLVLLRSKARMLALKDKLPDAIILLMTVTILVPTIFMQFYVVTATGKLTVLDNISEKSLREPTKYYLVKNYFINKKFASFRPIVSVGGKYNRDYNMYVYCALPILKNEADTSQQICNDWYCIKYFERISNKLSPEIKKQKFEVFIGRSLAKFDSLNIDNFVYLNRIEQIFDKNGYCQAINNNIKFMASQATILLPINEPFEQRNGTILYWFLGTFMALNLSLLIFIFAHKFKGETTNVLE